MKDHYEVLGVARGASQEDIKTAYRRCAMKYHPDRHPGNAEYEARFKECQAAYATLGDPGRRRQHDLGEAQAAGGFGPDSGLDELFRSIFDNLGAREGGAFHRRASTRGADLHTTLNLTLEQALAGGSQRLSYPAWTACVACTGTGSTDGQTETCEACKGAGSQPTRRGFFMVQDPCTRCKGRGRIPRKPCAPCGGRGGVDGQRTVQVELPPGVEDGDRLRLEGQGGHGTPPGDLLIRVQVAEHPTFQRQGRDLHGRVPIRVTQAALGATVSVSTPLGEVALDVPAGTQHGTVLTVAGRGVPALGRNAAGHLRCHIVVETPSNLTQKQRDLLRQLDASYRS